MSPRPVEGPLASLERILVGTRNEPKLAAVRAAFGSFAGDFTVAGVEVESGVPEQPVGFEEIVRGARNRAAAARATGGCDFAVGIEDGLVPLPAGAAARASVVNVGCAAVCDGSRVSIGFSSGFAYPPGVAEPAAAKRLPIGDLFDDLWKERRGQRDALPSARTTGNVGKLTLGALPRDEYARHAVICALIPFLHPDLYPEPEPAA